MSGLIRALKQSLRKVPVLKNAWNFFWKLDSKELRAIRKSLLLNRALNSRGVDELSYDKTQNANGKRALSRERYRLVISHTNYLTALGGVEKILHEQTMAWQKQGLGTVHLFPTFSGPVYLAPRTARFGVLIDGKFHRELSIGQLGELVQSFSFEQAWVHHFKNWPIPVLVGMLKELKENQTPVFLYLHDFFSLCPNANLVCQNDHVAHDDCLKGGKPGGRANHCVQTFGSDCVEKWREGTAEILRCVDKVFSPSDFLKAQFLKRFAGDISIDVKPPIQFLPQAAAKVCLAEQGARKLKVAYYGYPSELKGWKVWQELVQDPQLLKSYDFIVLGAEESQSPHVKAVGFHFSDGFDAGVGALRANLVDVVLLWSTVPESFSFTFHEAQAAGAYVLTSSQSGNIAWALKNHSEFRGAVLENVKDLRQLLLDEKQLRRKIEQKSPRAFEVSPAIL